MTKETVLTAGALLGLMLAPLVPASAAPATPAAAKNATVSTSIPNIAVPATRCIAGICIRGRVTVLSYSASSVLAYYDRNANNSPIGGYSVVKPGTSTAKSKDVDTITVPIDYWNRDYRIYYQYGYSGIVHMHTSRNKNLSDGTHLVVYIAKKR